VILSAVGVVRRRGRGVIVRCDRVGCAPELPANAAPASASATMIASDRD
jgi:hypothetical protein